MSFTKTLSDVKGYFCGSCYITMKKHKYLIEMRNYGFLELV